MDVVSPVVGRGFQDRLETAYCRGQVMADHSVKLPEARDDDSEDVVWGLSTASALWARGERRDAVVWIRRAAEAAEAAGNPFRALRRTWIR